ncbi:DUF805 domain-containing protein [Salipiger sp.]|uniref:DUF805 domain-containing protein n=1 Tax=Salipiger sp. TaxID=2078585 RepID=UPI003A981500
MFGPLAALESYVFNAFNFSGRASRSEYWWAVLLVIAITLLSLVVDGVTLYRAYTETGMIPMSFTSYLSPVVYLLTLVPNLSSSVRRMHDTGRSALWLLVAFVPVVGWMVQIVLLLLPGDEQDNSWGNPRAPLGTVASRGESGRPSSGPGRSNPLDAYAVLLHTDRQPSPEEVARRKQEIHEYFQRNVSRRAVA